MFRVFKTEEVDRGDILSIFTGQLKTSLNTTKYGVENIILP